MNTDNWFTVESIDGDTYAISEYRHWEKSHCYLLLGTEKSLLIDTGLGVSNIAAVVDGLTPLPVEVITTHAHWDHIGGHKYFENIAIHEAEKDWLSERFPLPLEAVKKNLTYMPCDFPADFSIDDYKIYQGAPQKILHDGDRLDLGNRALTVIHAPGHSPGHCCFYGRDRKYLYSGDLIYSGCLDAFYPTTDPLLFWQSVQKIQTLDIDCVLPGHRSLSVSTDIIDRIEQGFHRLSGAGRLRQGTGVFDFGDFQIHL